MSSLRFAWFVTLAIACITVPVAAQDHAAYSARGGLDVAHDAALSWSPDAQLIYVENDEVITMDGGAVRWSYLFRSERKGKARGYTVRDVKSRLLQSLCWQARIGKPCPLLASFQSG